MADTLNTLVGRPDGSPFSLHARIDEAKRGVDKSNSTYWTLKVHDATDRATVKIWKADDILSVSVGQVIRCEKATVNVYQGPKMARPATSIACYGDGVSFSGEVAPPPPAWEGESAPAELPSHAPGTLTDEQMISAVERWVTRLDGSAKHLSPENMSTILGSLMIGVSRGDVKLAQPAAPPPPAQRAATPAATVPHDDSDIPPNTFSDDELIPF